MSENTTQTMDFWNKAKRPPKEALKVIKAGRLKGMTDISPQWRYKIMTEHFGPCGAGWYYEIKRVWSEDGAEGQKFAFAEVLLYTWVKERDKWSQPVSGIGGSMLVSKESRGLHSSDEGYKMAVTDALSVAMKMLGVAADIYLGKFDGSKYAAEETDNGFITKAQVDQITKLIKETKSDTVAFLDHVGKAETVDTIATSNFNACIAALNKKKAMLAKERQPGDDGE